ncbi:alpha/beta fold hydrolase [Streptomyces sp. TRM72054]|uniref:esterase/lipase family protein n=1 Tax=Streptomyces sp. TRM72054 TaxID=2870562 RepID=UPI001C8C34A9|nr:alpha/beta fold hydrolase [Streptomyces sp. TRM72054]MBX9397264.1 alpha/beta fold hydrolase [Streptomyces sp. TRM72054]
MSLPPLPPLPGVNDDDARTEITRIPERLAGHGTAAGHRFAAAIDPAPAEDDWGRPPDLEHPYPVVLAHGTLGDRDSVWRQAVPALRAAGHRVFRLNYGALRALPGHYGLADIRASARELADFIDRVLADTGAARVNVVGHSQGGMLPHYCAKYLGAAAKLHHVVGIAPSNHGVTVAGLTALVRGLPGVRDSVEAEVLFRISPAFTQLLHDSELIRELTVGGDTVTGVRHTVLWSTRDEVVQPPASQQLTPAEPGHEVTNLCLQDLDPANRATHLAMPYDPVVLREVLRALEH